MYDRYKLFSLILYDDTDSYDINEVLRNIKGFKYYAYIKHDQDLDKDNLIKKVHYHVVIRLDNACTCKALAKKLGVCENHIQHIRNERSMLRYLIHFDDEDKYQYDFSEIKSSRSYAHYVNRAFDDFKTEEEKIDEIFNFINEYANTMNYVDFMRIFIPWLNTNCYYSLFNRYRKEFTNILNIYS